MKTTGNLKAEVRSSKLTKVYDKTKTSKKKKKHRTPKDGITAPYGGNTYL